MWFFPTKKEVEIELSKLNSKITELEKSIITKDQVELIFRKLYSELNTGMNSTRTNKTLVSRVLRARPELIKRTIRELLNQNLPTNKIFELVVTQQKLISKTQFYHYLSIVRLEVHTELQPDYSRTN